MYDEERKITMSVDVQSIRTKRSIERCVKERRCARVAINMEEERDSKSDESRGGGPPSESGGCVSPPILTPATECQAP